ncbi:MAG: hypothetical protein Q9184_001791 [Pyrenodesmia sp. 2 TL-2023]
MTYEHILLKRFELLKPHDVAQNCLLLAKTALDGLEEKSIETAELVQSVSVVVARLEDSGQIPAGSHAIWAQSLKGQATMNYIVEYSNQWSRKTAKENRLIYDHWHIDPYDILALGRYPRPLSLQTLRYLATLSGKVSLEEGRRRLEDAIVKRLKEIVITSDRKSREGVWPGDVESVLKALDSKQSSRRGASDDEGADGEDDVQSGATDYTLEAGLKRRRCSDSDALSGQYSKKEHLAERAASPAITFSDSPQPEVADSAFPLPCPISTSQEATESLPSLTKLKNTAKTSQKRWQPSRAKAKKKRQVETQVEAQVEAPEQDDQQWPVSALSPPLLSMPTFLLSPELGSHAAPEVDFEDSCNWTQSALAQHSSGRRTTELNSVLQTPTRKLFPMSSSIAYSSRGLGGSSSQDSLNCFDGQDEGKDASPIEVPEGPISPALQCPTARSRWRLDGESMLTDDLITLMLSLVCFSCVVVDSLALTSQSTATVSIRRQELARESPMIVLPYHHKEAAHWTLGIYKRRLRMLEYYDSCRAEELPCEAVQLMTGRILTSLLGQEYSASLMTVKNMSSAQQTPGSMDCGLYIVENARAACAGHPPPSLIDGQSLRQHWARVIHDADTLVVDMVAPAESTLMEPDNPDDPVSATTAFVIGHVQEMEKKLLAAQDSYSTAHEAQISRHHDMINAYSKLQEQQHWNSLIMPINAELERLGDDPPPYLKGEAQKFSEAQKELERCESDFQASQGEWRALLDDQNKQRVNLKEAAAIYGRWRQWRDSLPTDKDALTGPLDGRMREFEVNVELPEDQGGAA